MSLPRPHRLALSLAVLAAAACGDDGLSPREIAGTWVTDGAPLALADTLVLDAAGSGRWTVVQVIAPAEPGASFDTTATSSPIQYRIRGDRIEIGFVLCAACNSVPGAPWYGHLRGSVLVVEPSGITVNPTSYYFRRLPVMGLD